MTDMLSYRARIATPTILLFCLIVGLVWLQRPRAQERSPHHHQTGAVQSRDDLFSRAMVAAMETMHKGMMAPLPTGNVDVDFLAAMVPHHAGAVEMARLVLVHGRDPLVRRLAEEIIAGQQAEIAAMEARLRILRQGADPNPDGYPSLGSTRGAAH